MANASPRSPPPAPLTLYATPKRSARAPIRLIDPPVIPAAGEPQLSVAQWARRLRTRFQLGLVGWIRGERPEQNLEILETVAHQLEQVATRQPVFQLWWVVGAIIEALREGGLETGVSIKRLLGLAVGLGRPAAVGLRVAALHGGLHVALDDATSDPAEPRHELHVIDYARTVRGGLEPMLVVPPQVRSVHLPVHEADARFPHIDPRLPRDGEAVQHDDVVDLQAFAHGERSLGANLEIQPRRRQLFEVGCL